jgi:signal transduction histidine kinase
MTPTWSPEQLDALNRLTTVARLLSTAVHETGNALQVISGNAEMIEGAADAAKTADRAHRIKVHADQAGTRLQFLAALANTDSAAPRTLDLRRLAEQAIDLRRYSLNRARIAISLEGGRTAAVLGSEAELIRLIANLLLNAEHAVKDQADPAIHLGLTDAGGSIALAVSDNGPGVPEAMRESIFLPFAADRPPGCGLAVARWIAMRHRGTLVLDASVKPGARFVVSLPPYSSAVSPMPSR